MHGSHSRISVGQNFCWIKQLQLDWLKQHLELLHKWNICPAVTKIFAVFINLLNFWVKKRKKKNHKLKWLLINHRAEKLKLLLQTLSQLCWHEYEVFLLKLVRFLRHSPPYQQSESISVCVSDIFCVCSDVFQPRDTSPPCHQATGFVNAFIFFFAESSVILVSTLKELKDPVM